MCILRTTWRLRNVEKSDFFVITFLYFYLYLCFFNLFNFNNFHRDFQKKNGRKKSSVKNLSLHFYSYFLLIYNFLFYQSIFIICLGVSGRKEKKNSLLSFSQRAHSWSLKNSHARGQACRLVLPGAAHSWDSRRSLSPMGYLSRADHEWVKRRRGHELPSGRKRDHL